MTNEQTMRVAIQSGAEIDDRYMYSITFTEKGLYEFARAIAASEKISLADSVEKDMYSAMARQLKFQHNAENNRIGEVHRGILGFRKHD